MDPLLFSNLTAHASQAALLTLGAVVVARLLPRRHPQLTLTIWQAVLLATAILPFLQPWTPVSYRFVLSARVVPSADAVAPAANAGFVLPGVLLPIVGTLLALGVVVRLAWIGVGLWRLDRFTRVTPRMVDLPEAVRAAMRDSGTVARFHGSELSGPVSFGLRHGVVLLPRDFGALDRGAQYLVAFHELLHVRRRDALQCLLEEVLVALFWFYPWVWWIRGRIRLAREQVVDRGTARTRIVRNTYIKTLLRFSGEHPRPLPTASGMWRARELRARIDALYQEVTMSRSRIFVSAAATALALGAIAVLGATAFPLYSTLPTVDAPRTAYLTTAHAPAYASVARQSAQEDEVVRVGGDVKPPRKTKHVNPVYPQDAKDAGIQGVVIVEAVIDKEGKVSHAEVVRSIPELDQAALDAVLQWEFEPTYVKGKAVSVRMTVTINFTLA